MRRSIAPPSDGATCPSGLPAAADPLPWGTHATHFYRDESELVETAAGFFSAGLLANERCLWITAPPLTPAHALEALRRGLPDATERHANGQLEIVEAASFCADAGHAQEAVHAWLDRETDALAAGYEGLRISVSACNACGGDRTTLAAYEAVLHQSLHGRRIFALCSYALDRCDPDTIVDVLRNHAFALLRRGGVWEAIQSATTMLASVAEDSTSTLLLDDDDDGSPYHCASHADGKIDPLEEDDRTRAELEQLRLALRSEALRRERIERQRDHLLEEERTLRLRAQSASEHLARLQELTSALFDAATPTEVAHVATSVLVGELGADIAEVSVTVDPDRPPIVLARSGDDVLPDECSSSNADHLPCCEAFRTGAPVWSSTREEVQARHPSLAAARPDLCAVAFVPITLKGVRIGVMRLYYTKPHAPRAFERALLEDYARQVALALDRARSYDQARQERERAEQEQLRAERERERAEEASRAKDEFLAMLGHELRNPLSPLLTAVELMRLRGGDQNEMERTIIERQVNHMVRLVDDLLDISRITRGKVKLKRDRVELAVVVASAIEIASPALEERAHELVVEVPRTGLTVEGDADRLVQVVTNLLTNAAKYTPRNGRIEIVGRSESGTVVLSVKDNGRGIEPELLPKVFDLFQQGKRKSDRGEGGLGLGLAIARNLTELHGGTLRAESVGRGMGSTFVLELPRMRDSAPKLSHESTEVPALRKQRILIVDDNADAAFLLGELLEARGHIVRVSHDGPSALATVSEFRPEVAILDIGLPVMDGYELAQRLSALDSQDPPRLIAVTGYGQETDRLRSRASGFAEHLVKPIDIRQLELVIAGLGPDAEAARRRSRSA